MAVFTLSSPDLGGQFEKRHEYGGFGCDGDNISPTLEWANAPEGTKSFALTVYDPDAPTGSGWWHWLAFNIPSDVHKLGESAGNPETGLAPAGCVQSINDYGIYGFGGPCPPPGHGPHRYVFTIHALNVEKLDLDKDTNAAIVGFNINGHTIQKASIMPYYER